MIKICGTGSALPARTVTNDDLSKIMDTSDEWISSRTGIRSRHLAVEETTTGMSVAAAKQAMEEAGLQAEKLDLIIAATLSPDHVLPTLACEVQAALGAMNAVAFDLHAACSGFLFSMNTAAAYMQSGVYKNALIIGAETLSKMMDWNDRGTCVLFGDGAGAAVLCNMTDEVTNGGLRSFVQYSDGARGGVLACGNRPVCHPFASHEPENQYVAMDGQAVYKFAVSTVPKVVTEAVEKAGLTLADIDHFVLHQANQRIIESVAKRLKQPMEKFPMNLQDCGNISAASVPILLDSLNKNGMIKANERIVLAGFGAGLTWGAAVIQW
ncbi:MAG: beta-ketoacyl-ACP synthase III [Lachnospiraceae bacterium]